MVIDHLLKLGFIVLAILAIEAFVALVLVVSKKSSLVLWHDHTHVTDFDVALDSVSLSEAKSGGSRHDFSRIFGRGSDRCDSNWHLDHAALILTNHVLWLMALRIDDGVL